MPRLCIRWPRPYTDLACQPIAATLWKRARSATIGARGTEGSNLVPSSAESATRLYPQSFSQPARWDYATIVEIEYGRLLPPTLQVHVARIPLLSRGSDDIDVDYQARLLGSAKVEVVALAQTGATLSADDYDEQITKRMSEAAGVRDRGIG